ncbi:MAG: 2,3-bisphosphoglycerate-independent phosphoglycerate mutase [Kiritimatiellia bacterium]|jgi:2,3-bisphosphoglycerate-independent phosphoglycerate mutase
MNPLNSIDNYARPEGPVVLVIMDGVGIGGGDAGDMVAKATKPHLDWLQKHALSTRLRAHGSAVGMPSEGDMGNSEVGHNAIGCGRVFDQGAKLVQEAIASGALFEGETWKDLISNVKTSGGTLHFMGLLSDGNVHTHIDHLLAMLRQAALEGVTKARIHTLLDGRDVPPTSALVYIAQLQAVLDELNAGGVDFAIASGGGRLYITMDRYNADWPMVERGWNTHVKGEGRRFNSASEAVETLRAETPGVIDQDLHEFVIERDGAPIGPIVDGDSVILFNYRGDRAQEITRAFDEPDLDTFNRGPIPNVQFAGMMQYDADLKIPKAYLVVPPSIDRTLGEFLAASGQRQLAVSETQKYGHVTYFFNGNKSGKFDDALEDYVEIPSDLIPYEQRPWMKAGEITEVALESITGNKHDFIRINYPNGDMVGHTGNLLAVEISVEATDLMVGRLMKAIEAAKGVLIVTADHGNADEMFELDKAGVPKVDTDGKPRMKTSHTLNPVPCYIYDPAGTTKARLSAHDNLGISSLAATVMQLLGFTPPEDYDPSIVDVG